MENESLGLISLALVFMFLSIILSVIALVHALNRRKVVSIIAFSLFFLISTVLTLLYVYDLDVFFLNQRGETHDYLLSGSHEHFQFLESGCMVIALFDLSYLAYSYLSKNVFLSLLSVQQGMDDYEEGIFCYDDTSVILENQIFRETVLSLIKENLYDGDALWKRITELGEIRGTEFGQYIFDINHKEIAFQRELVQTKDNRSYYEITCKDITKEMNLITNLEATKAELSKREEELKASLQEQRPDGLTVRRNRHYLRNEIQNELTFEITSVQEGFSYPHSEEDVLHSLDHLQEKMKEIKTGDSDPKLISELNKLKEKMERKGLEITFNGNYPKYSYHNAFLFYASQEAAENSLTHGHARHLMISFEENLYDFHITLEDDGIGAPTGFLYLHGLKTIKTEVLKQKGQLEISSTPHFSIRITFPILDFTLSEN